MNQTENVKTEKAKPEIEVDPANVPDFNPDRRKLPPGVKPIGDCIPAAIKDLFNLKHPRKGVWR